MCNSKNGDDGSHLHKVFDYFMCLIAGLLDKDDAGPNHGFGGAQSSGDEDSDEERQVAVAAAVAQKARARGGSATAALQRAEEAGASKPTGGQSGGRMCKAIFVAGIVAAACVPDAEGRAAVASKQRA